MYIDIPHYEIKDQHLYVTFTSLYVPEYYNIPTCEEPTITLKDGTPLDLIAVPNGYVAKLDNPIELKDLILGANNDRS